ncbi:MAG: aminopeptidase [Mariniphaga sp.]|nr:aminopeptidase [Mariniphaga sp.]
MQTIKKRFLLALTLFLVAGFSYAGNKDNEGYKFQSIKEIPHTSVKNQFRSGTCWSFAGMSFFESEMLRMGKPEVDLSEMFPVSMCYRDKAIKYVRMQGNTNFGAGGVLYDDLYVANNYGLVPEKVFPGIKYDEEKHVHGEMDNVLRNMVEAVVENKNKKMSPVWDEAVNSTIDSYLGVVPQNFEYKGKNYTPKSFASDFCGINGDEYVQITSFTHHPFYQQFILEVPDNWLWSEFYNVPLDELQEIVDASIENGYSVLWAADVSEKGFATTQKGIAVIPEKITTEMNDAEISKWDSLSEKEKESSLYKFDKPGKERIITQEVRQMAFDSQETTDDHAMHLIGLAKDENGTVYYKVKNSWGKYNDLKGYFYASKPYLRYKTTAIVVNKAAIPEAIRKKMKL